MKGSNFVLESRSVEEVATERLLYWLKYETKTVFIGGGIFWLPVGIVSGLMIILAFGFTPYLLMRLFQARLFKSIIVFTFLVLVPMALTQFVNPQEVVLNYVLSFGPLFAFYLFLFIQKWVLEDHLEDLKGKRLLEN